MSTTVVESVHIAADPHVVYDLVADRAGVGAISPEAVGALGAPTRPGVGDTFWGMNRRGPWVWATQCHITTADPGRAFAFDVAFGPFPVSSWSYTIEATDEGCTVTETWVDRREGRRGAFLSAAGSLIIPGPRDEHNRRNIIASLASLKAAAEIPAG